MRALRLVVAVSILVSLAGCASEAPNISMPDVLGKTLDVARSDIERAGIREDIEVLGGGMFGILNESNWVVCEQLPLAGKTVSVRPRLTVERTCDQDPLEASDEQEPSSGDDSYAYTGPAYEVVVVDKNRSAARLSQYWVYTEPFDYSTEAYKDLIKLVITDIGRAHGTADMFVEVVTDREIALAESPSTFQQFIDEHGTDYAVKTIPEKEKLHWVASYTGGFDHASGEASDSVNAYEISWFIATKNDIERWKPEVSD